jgi:hypothetical protein
VRVPLRRSRRSSAALLVAKNVGCYLDDGASGSRRSSRERQRYQRGLSDRRRAGGSAG